MKLFEIVGKILIENKEAKDELKETTATAEKSSDSMKASFKKIATAVVSAFAVRNIVDFGKKCLETSASIQASTSQFQQTFTTGGKDLTATAKNILNEIAKDSGILATRLQDNGTKIYAFAKSSGATSEEAMALMDEALRASADSAAYYDRSLEDTTETMMSFLKGNFENDAALGVSATEFTRNAKASELFGKKFNELSEIQKQQTLLKMVTDSQKLSGAMGQASREADGWENVQGNLNEVWRRFLGVLGAPILKSVVPIVKNLGGAFAYVTDTLSNADSLGEGFKQIFIDLSGNIKNAIPTFVKNAQQMMSEFGETLKANLPNIISKGLDIILGLSQIMLANVPKLVGSGMDMIKNIVIGLVKSLPTLIQKVPEIITNFANTFSMSAQTIFLKGAEIIWEIIKGIISAIPDLIANIPQIFEAIFSVWNAVNWWNLGKNLITGIWNGIKNLGSMLVEGVKGIFNNLKNNVVGIFNGVSSSASNIWNAVKNNIVNIVNGLKTSLTNIVNAIKNGIVNVWEGIKAVTNTVFNAIKNIVSTVWNGIKLSVSGVVNGIKSTISGVWNSIKSITSSVWNGVLNAIKSPLNTAKKFVKGIIDTIKGFFSFKISWPKIPLPHFSIKPSGWGIGDLLKGKIPSLGIDWYAKGGILTEPTAFGVSPSGNLRVGGEAGDEAVAPIDTLLGYVRTAVNESNGGLYELLKNIILLLSDYLPQLASMQMVLDTGTLVGEIAPQVDEELGDIQRRKGR